MILDQLNTETYKDIETFYNISQIMYIYIQ